MYLIYMLVFIMMCIMLGHVRYVHLILLQINGHVLPINLGIILRDQYEQGLSSPNSILTVSIIL